MDIQLNSTVRSAGLEGSVTLSDGRKLSADLVVAADGINSTIRDAHDLARSTHLGARLRRPHQHPETARRDRRRRSRGHRHDRGLGGQAARALLPGDKGRILRAADLHHRRYRRRDLADRSGRLGTLFPTMRDLFVRVRDEGDWPQSHWAHFQTIRLKRWPTGRIAMVGDAAHAMPPYLAQGAGHAMMNALGLAQALDEHRPSKPR